MMYRVIAAVLFLVALYGYGHHKGWAERDAEMQAEIALRNEESRAKEKEMHEMINDKNTQLKEANDVVSKKSDDLNRFINSGRLRLGSSSCVQASSSATPASGNSNQTSSESDRETLRLIAEIAADGDKAINQLNACIDAYNAVRESINGQR